MSRPHVPGVPVRAGRIGGHREPIDIVRKVVTTLCAMKCEMVIAIEREGLTMVSLSCHVRQSGCNWL